MFHIFYFEQISNSEDGAFPNRPLGSSDRRLRRYLTFPVFFTHVIRASTSASWPQRWLSFSLWIGQSCHTYSLWFSPTAEIISINVINSTSIEVEASLL